MSDAATEVDAEEVVWVAESAMTPHDMSALCNVDEHTAEEDVTAEEHVVTQTDVDAATEVDAEEVVWVTESAMTPHDMSTLCNVDEHTADESV